jgi:hypothetical protein
MGLKLRKKTILLLLLTVVNIAFSQNKVVLHHQMLASQGNRVLTSNGLYVSQSIGQQSIAGNYIKNGMLVQQGFQQYELFKTIMESPEDGGVTTSFYPNPFVNDVIVEFSSKINGVCEIRLLDMSGKVLYRDSRNVDNNRLVISSLDYLPSGIYVVHLSALNYNCTVKLIKK